MPDTDVVPFRVSFDAAAIGDLRARLRNTRWPERETVDDWSQGIPLAFVQDLANPATRDLIRGAYKLDGRLLLSLDLGRLLAGGDWKQS